MSQKIGIILLLFLFFPSQTVRSQKVKPSQDKTSYTLMKNTWSALAKRDFDTVASEADKCLRLYQEKAGKMQTRLRAFPSEKEAFDYWALNDVATCLFVKAKAMHMQGRDKEAVTLCRQIIEHYGYSQCWDPRGWFWKVADAAYDQIVFMEAHIDFGDYSSSTLTVKAWQAMTTGHYDEALVFTRKCIYLYRQEAQKMQDALKQYPGKDKAFDFWALNDVGTCYFMMGEIYLAKQKWDKAKEAYKKLTQHYSFAQCWDPNGQFFWKPALQAKVTLDTLLEEQ